MAQGAPLFLSKVQASSLYWELSSLLGGFTRTPMLGCPAEASEPDELPWLVSLLPLTANSLLQSHEAPLEGQGEEMAPPRGPSTLCDLYTKLQSFPRFCSSQSSSLSGVHPSHPHPSSVTSSWVTRHVRAEAGIPGGPSVPMADCQTSLRTFFLQSLGLEPGVRHGTFP